MSSPENIPPSPQTSESEKPTTTDTKHLEKTTTDPSSPYPLSLTPLKHADPSSADAALAVLTTTTPLLLTPPLSRHLLRKTDRHILPLLCLVYGLNYLDKTSISYASIMGFQSDTHLTPGSQQYSWVASMFYFGYLFAEYPTTRLLQRLPLAKWSAFNVVMWGLVLCCLAACDSFASAMAVRFFLGVFEAAVSPGFALFTSQWYTVREQGLRTGVWFSFNGWGQIVGGVLAYGIAVGTKGRELGGGVKGWQLLFLVIGLFTAAVGVLFFWVMPDNQLNARFLTEEERVLAVERIRVNQQGVGNKQFKWYQFREAVTDPMVWAFVFFSLVADIPNGGMTNFFSQLIVSFGFSRDKLHNRLLVSTSGMVLATLGMLLVTCLDNSHNVGKLIGYYLTQASPTPFVALLSLISTNVAGWTKKTTVAAMYFIGYCVGNIIGPQVFRAKDKPEYRPAKIVIIVCYFLSVVDILFIYWWCRSQNKMKAVIRAQPGYTKLEGQEFYDLTDRENPEFIYSL